MNAGVPSAHPTRHPGPTILLKLPLLMQLPNLSIGPPSRVASISTSRGISDVNWTCEAEVDEEEEEEETESDEDDEDDEDRGDASAEALVSDFQ